MKCQCVCETCLLGEHCDTATCAMDMPPKFTAGQRVIVTKGWSPNETATTPETYNHIGYYGHVEHIDPASDVVLENVYWVRLLGRSGCEAAPWMLQEPWFNPFGFWEYQLEAAD